MATNTQRLLIGAFAASIAGGIAPPAQALMLAEPAAPGDAISRSVVTFFGGCTGTLIDKEWVITANHCIPGVAKIGKVLIGPDIGQQELVSVAETYESPAARQGTKAFDVGLVKLATPAVTIPAKIYQGDNLAPIGTPITAYGWGNIAEGWETKIPTATGKVVPAKFAPPQTYSNMRGVNIQLDGEVKHVWGDSGGPAFINGELYGILSGAAPQEDDPKVGSTGVYTTTPEIQRWITETTGIDFFDGKTNQAIDAQLEGVTYSFREAAPFTDTADAERQAILDYRAGNLDIDSRRLSVYSTVINSMIKNQYVDPIVGSDVDAGETIPEAEQQDVQNTVEEIINDPNVVAPMDGAITVESSDTTGIPSSNTTDTEGSTTTPRESSGTTPQVSNPTSQTNNSGTTDASQTPDTKDPETSNTTNNASPQPTSETQNVGVSQAQATPLVTRAQVTPLAKTAPQQTPAARIATTGAPQAAAQTAASSATPEATQTESTGIKVATGGTTVGTLLAKIKAIF